jgi:hypothetical protein
LKSNMSHPNTLINDTQGFNIIKQEVSSQLSEKDNGT